MDLNDSMSQYSRGHPGYENQSRIDYDNHSMNSGYAGQNRMQTADPNYYREMSMSQHDVDQQSAGGHRGHQSKMSYPER